MRKLWVVLAVVAAMAVSVFGYRYYLISELRKPVLAELNDPDSAKFRNEWLASGWTVKGGILCGEVNSKNRMGGYVGYVKFSSFAGVHVDIGSSDLGLEVVDAACSRDD